MASNSDAVSKHGKFSISDHLECTLCLEVFKSPRALACMHTFCETCIQSLVTKAAENGAVISSINCPVCRKTTPAPKPNDPPTAWARALPLNYAIVPLIEELEALRCESESVNLGKLEYCQEHLDKKAKFYCQDHGALCCSSCAIANHRPCSSVVEMKQTGRDVQLEKKPRKLLTKMEKLQTQLGEITKKLETNVLHIGEQAEDIIRHVLNVRDTVVEMFENLVFNIASKCSEMKEEQTTRIANTIYSQRSVMAAIASSRSFLESVMKQGTESQIFIAFYMIESQLADYERQVNDESQRTSTVELYLELDAVVETILKAATDLASIKVSHIEIAVQDPRALKAEKVHPIHVAETISQVETPVSSVNVSHHTHAVMDARAPMGRPINEGLVRKLPNTTVKKRANLKPPFYSGAVCLPNGRLVTVDGANHLCCLLNDSYDVIADVKLSSRPTDLAVFGQYEVAVVLPYAREIQVVTIGDRLSLGLTINCSRQPVCVSRTRIAELAVGWETGFSFLTANGGERNYVGAANSDEAIKFSETDRLAVDVSQSRLYRSCYNTNTVYCYSLKGELLFAYSNGLKCPKGVALDRDGHLYISSVDRIHKVSADGTRICTIDRGTRGSSVICYLPAEDQMLAFLSGSDVQPSIWSSVLKVQFLSSE